MHQGFGDAGEAQRLCWESSFSGHRKVGHGAGRRGKLALAWRHSSALSPQVSGAREPSAFHAPRLPPPQTGGSMNRLAPTLDSQSLWLLSPPSNRCPQRPLVSFSLSS